MYQRFYQLATNPFRLAPEPDFCFSHTGYKRAKEYLDFALAQGEGFVLVTGRPGTGKTMLVETFLKGVNTSEVVARRIAVSSYSAVDLLRTVAYAYGINAAGMDEGTMRYRIQEFFVQQEQAGRRVLLIIDEAQALSHVALEELRILADMQTQSRLMLQLFLVGQESLQELMSTPAMEQFQQRVIANYELVPLNLKDTRAYIEHRLLQAGWNGDPEFSSTAVLSIYQLSNGVPRHINKICNRLLLLGFGKASHVFEEQDVLDISAEMRNERLTPLEVNQVQLHDADNVTDISEIRDGQVSVTDLAIRVNKVNARAATISEGPRHVALNKEAFIARHQSSPASNDEETAAPGIESLLAVSVTSEPLHVANASNAAADHSDGTDKNLQAERSVWRAAVTVLAVMLILLMVFIASVPSLPVSEDVREMLSFNDHFSRWSQQLAALQVKYGTTDAGGEIEAEVQGASVGEIIRHEVKENVPRPLIEVPVPSATVVDVVEQTGDTRADEIEKLLAQARQALDDYRLVTPEGDNAHEYLLAVLQLDPENVKARAGIQAIVDIYISLATKKANEYEFARAQRYIDRGLGILPDNPELLALKDAVNQKTVNNKSENASVAQGTAGAEEQVAGEYTLLQKQLSLRKRQAADRRRDASAATDRD